jgi:hypothetical protein
MLVTRALPGISNSARSVAIPAVDKLVRRAALVAQGDDRPRVRRQADDAVVSTRP